MRKVLNSMTFDEYPPHEIMGRSIYNNSNKRLSLQFRNITDDRLIAYIALSEENIPDMNEQLNGCRILDIYAEKIRLGNYEIPNTSLLTRLIDEAEYNIRNYGSNQNPPFQFNYLWFRTTDINLPDIREIIDGLSIQEGIACKRYPINDQLP